MKSNSVFYKKNIIERIKENIERYSYAQDIKMQQIEEAKPWMGYSDDELWGFMFGNTLKRSWMVWSSGYCPSCNKDVTMYAWKFDPLNHPWKAQCPHCEELFPKNDFYGYYLSGLDNASIFQYQLADNSLLYNTEHPNPEDPLYKFGVDAGEGFVDPENGNCWRFIATYLIYGQWKKLIVGGIEKLANAYVVTGDMDYANKAGILLDRIADFYPTFDFGEQGILYEKKGQSGYVSTWHDANMETKELALAYDKIFEGLKEDNKLIDFLSRKSKAAGLQNKKESFEAIQTNIEDRILRDATLNRPKITLNFPGTDITMILLQTILEWPEKREEIEAYIDDIVERATNVDGVTGEKGLANYSALTMNKFAEFLVLYELADEKFLEKAVQKHPHLKRSYKFFIDTWCLESYYPLTGDTGAFAKPVKYYRGVLFENSPGLDLLTFKKVGTNPSMYTFIWKLYKITGDAAYAKIMYKSNNYSVKDLPYDVTAINPLSLQQELNNVIKYEGSELNLESLNKEQWHLAIIRSGKGKDERALWLDYDSGFSHGHNDGMNIGLFAKGLDLLPDFGYKPVQFGGWFTPMSKWYTKTAAHNTVVVDGKDDNREVGGVTTLWSIGKGIKIVKVSAPELINGKQFERTLAMIDISDKDSYILDIFRVAGGKDHAKFLHSHYSSITCSGLSLKPTDDYGHDTLMRNFKIDENNELGWSVDWKVEDYMNLLPYDSDVHLKYTDLTYMAKAYVFEAWVSAGGTKQKLEKWIPGIMVRRQSEEEPLVSNFVGIIEPYECKTNLKEIKRLPLQTAGGCLLSGNNAAVEIVTTDDRRDLIISVDTEDPALLKQCINRNVIQEDWDLYFDGEICLISIFNNCTEKIAVCNGTFVSVKNITIRLKEKTAIFEAAFVNGDYIVITGDPENISEINIS